MSIRVKILDFDIENRPLAYLGMDFTTAEITAIGAAWHGSRRIRTWVLGENDPRTMLQEFRRLYDEADIVTGHYIRKHDLPVINGAMLEYGLTALGRKLTVDTNLDLKDVKHISRSMENLAGMLGLGHPKIHMSNAMWRDANRLNPAGIKLTLARVCGDVRLHMLLREKLVELDMLRQPREWKP
jgi:hypothetical protein